MAQIRTVSVEYRKKIQGERQYESNTVGIQLWADLDEGEDVDTVMHQLWSMATENVKAKVLSLTTRQVAVIEQTYLGLPVDLKEDWDESLEAEGNGNESREAQPGS
ncbi:MAG: hypothetical protein ACYC5M_09735 [Anaerolineae bacterium]